MNIEIENMDDLDTLFKFLKIEDVVVLDQIPEGFVAVSAATGRQLKRYTSLPIYHMQAIEEVGNDQTTVKSEDSGASEETT